MIKGVLSRPRTVCIKDSSLKYLFKYQRKTQLSPLITQSDAQSLYADFTKKDYKLMNIAKCDYNGNKLQYLLDNKDKVDLFDLNFNLSNGNDMILFLHLLQSNDLQHFKGIGSLMKRIVHSSHPDLGTGLDLLKKCGINSDEKEIKTTFQFLYSPKMKQITIDILIQNDPMHCLNFLEWYKESPDFDSRFYSFAKFKLLTQQFHNKFFIPIKFTQSDIQNIIKYHLASYLTLLMAHSDSIYSPKEKFDHFLGIYFKALEILDDTIPKNEIQKCNSQFLQFLVNHYKIDYSILLAYVTKLFPSESNIEFLLGLGLLAEPNSSKQSQLQSYLTTLDSLPKVSINDKLVSQLGSVSIYLSDLDLIYNQLLNHHHLSSKEMNLLFDKYIKTKSELKINFRGNNHPFSKHHHNTSILITFLKYVTFELNDLQLAYNILKKYIGMSGVDEFQRDLNIHKKHKIMIGKVLIKLSEFKFDNAVELHSQLNSIIWDWSVYWRLIVNASKLSQNQYAQHIWKKVRSHPELWNHITTKQAATLLNLKFDFNKDITMTIYEANKIRKGTDTTTIATYKNNKDCNFLVNELSPEYITNLLS